MTIEDILDRATRTIEAEQVVYLNCTTKVYHRDLSCPVAKRTRRLQATAGDGTDIWEGRPCSRCYR